MIVPTFNERDNVGVVFELVAAALDGLEWEMVFVDDDSADGTAEIVRSIARHDPRVRCIQRIGRRGLSTACIEGVLATASPYIAVMDADLQHDERLLPRMLEVLKQQDYDLVVGSRYVEGGGIGGWDDRRAGLSNLATKLSRIVCKSEIADPMSGFFMMRRGVFEHAMRNLSGQGFKILLDLLASSREGLRIKELPYQFRPRRHGTSKLDTLVAWEFGMLLADKLVGRFVPVRFALFAFIGVLGLGVHLTVLRAALAAPSFDFAKAQATATFVAMTSNFFLNNVFTYRDQRLRGWRLLRGLFSFYLICAVGAVGNVGIATYVFAADNVWWLAGIAGAIVGSVWNYAVSSVFTWRRR
ncbi:MAG TPA: glycosyltransferase family 2 protein [Stellaceae bacterium]|nr:glycosyltransferase family 2 protein [Stellaceae bacterium]